MQIKYFFLCVLWMIMIDKMLLLICSYARNSPKTQLYFKIIAHVKIPAYSPSLCSLFTVGIFPHASQYKCEI